MMFLFLAAYTHSIWSEKQLLILVLLLLIFSNLYNSFSFFTGTTARYQILNDKLATLNTKREVYTLKILSTTCWSCNYEAVKALAHQINEALTEINIDEEQKNIVKNKASGLIRTWLV
jgi:hypothetical protein